MRKKDFQNASRSTRKKLNKDKRLLLSFPRQTISAEEQRAPIARQTLKREPKPLKWHAVNPPPQQKLHTDTIGGSLRLSHALLDGARSKWKAARTLREFAHSIGGLYVRTIKVRRVEDYWELGADKKVRKRTRLVSQEEKEVESISELTKKLDAHFGTLYGGSLGNYSAEKRKELLRKL